MPVFSRGHLARVPEHGEARLCAPSTPSPSPDSLLSRAELFSHVPPQTVCCTTTARAEPERLGWPRLTKCFRRLQVRPHHHRNTTAFLP